LKLSELAIKDQLTNLYNRHSFNEIIERETARAERRAEPLSFIIIDVDNFKKINDTLGHFTGDRLLVEAANIIKTTVRKSDVVFRYGGDEFLIILMNADYDMSLDMVQRILSAVDKWNKDKMGSFNCRLSFSIGCSTCKKGRTIPETLEEADAMMYKNKNIL
ncbi:MAG: GGDEF domain-containing protein, partial [Actinobacteria bacterium]|nr:GGDEF domain-containing protein [Actinomycetota bacterium]